MTSASDLLQAADPINRVQIDDRATRAFLDAVRDEILHAPLAHSLVEHSGERSRQQPRPRGERYPKRRVLIGLPVLLACLVITSAAGAAIALSLQHPSNYGSKIVKQGSGSTTIAKARGELEFPLAAQFPAQYAGTNLSESGGGIIVYLTSVPPDIDTTISKYVDPSLVSFTIVPNSLAQLNAVSNSISQRFAQLEAQGILVTFLQEDFALNRVVLDVVNPTPAQISVLDADFGTQFISVVSVAQAPLGSSGALITQVPASASHPKKHS